VQSKHTRAGISRLEIALQITIVVQEGYPNTHLGIWRDTSNFYPAETKVEEPYGSASQYADVVGNGHTIVPSIASPSLSKPAAKPMGFDIASPQIYKVYEFKRIAIT
jgi:hypothetical protein